MADPDRDALLRTYLRELSCRDVEEGEPTCALALWEWWYRARGGKPETAPFSGYLAADADGRSAAHMRLPTLMALAARQVGAHRTDDPQVGDGAVIALGHRFFAAIRTPTNRWAVKCGSGLYATRSCRVIAAWTV